MERLFKGGKAQLFTCFADFKYILDLEGEGIVGLVVGVEERGFNEVEEGSASL